MLITYKFDLCLLANEPLLAVNNTQPLTLHLTPYLQHGKPSIG